MRLPQWSEDVVVRAQFPDGHSKMTNPYLYVESRFGRVPWKETMIELFAENWKVVEVKTNTQETVSKADYYINTYNEEFKFKHNSAIQIVSYMIVWK
ncbi:hypothetical protein FORC13_p034 (plasmid) [Bacillus cereus]|nr:hypothetical protein FORC13_p034 [Bacillus cereus]MEC2394238.1 hypothetical protein [Bacillus toyonensis]